jgi:hypothetical protein
MNDPNVTSRLSFRCRTLSIEANFALNSDYGIASTLLIAVISNLRMNSRVAPAITAPSVRTLHRGRVAHPSAPPRRTHLNFRVPHPYGF